MRRYIAKRPAYRKKDLQESSGAKNLFVGTMVPGQRMRIKPRQIVRVEGSRRTRMRRNSGQHGCRRHRQISQGKAGLQPVPPSG
jgi:hypothetical protein